MPSLLPSPYKLPSSPLSTKMLNLQPQLQAMSPLQIWETFSDDGGNSDNDNDDVLSLCDLPIRSQPADQDNNSKSSEALEDFEFRTCQNSILPMEAKDTDMCLADDIFFRGRLLPLRVSFLRPPRWGPKTDPSSGFGSNSIVSSSSSSATTSRSHSSNSHSSNCDAPMLTINSSTFSAHPSLRPHNPTSIGSGSAVFRPRAAKAPGSEFNELKLRKLRSKDSSFEAKWKYSVPRFGFGCKCASDACERVSMSPNRPLIPKLKNKKKKVLRIGLEGEESNCKSSRMSEWLEELSIGKGSAVT